MTRKLVILALVSVCFAYVPTHNVKPLPDFVDKAIQLLRDSPFNFIVAATRPDSLSFRLSNHIIIRVDNLFTKLN